MSRAVTAALAAAAGLLLLGAAPAPQAPGPSSGVAVASIPQAARAALPLIVDLTAEHCPELPPVWVVAQVQAESGWAETAGSDGGPAGLLRFDERNWVAAGGGPWTADPPVAGEPVLTAADHLAVAIPWMCTNLRAVTRHLDAARKPTAPLDAMLVCHIAGCGRVVGSATGVPAAGEAGCATRCAQLVASYLDAVHALVERFADDAPAAAPERAVPTAWTGGATGCDEEDPTGDGCVTGATLHGLTAATKVFGSWSDGPVIRSAGCWDAHAWNPRSDHPRGRACDLFPSAPGRFATGDDLDAGWRVARWFSEHADALRVRYLIWQGRYWAPGVADQGDWGRRYSGGGVYDTRDATGGHYDHVHVSFRE
ncbi:hypothetical protein [Pseudonocardia sp.]|uniref:hypothetical protein n=1 Tax=Pseudonocardia sp. TaxID=60912 RepID=UPI003D0DF6A5